MIVIDVWAGLAWLSVVAISDHGILSAYIRTVVSLAVLFEGTMMTAWLSNRAVFTVANASVVRVREPIVVHLGLHSDAHRPRISLRSDSNSATRLRRLRASRWLILLDVYTALSFLLLEQEKFRQCLASLWI